MGLLPITLDTARRKIVISPSNSDEFLLGNIYQEDILQIQFQAIKPTGNVIGSNRYEVLNLTGYALDICVAAVKGTPLAQATTFTISADGKTLEGDFNLNTAGINALADGASLYFEVNLSYASKPTRAQQVVTYVKAACVSGSLVAVPTDTALGSLAADRTYVRKEGRAGEAIILTSADGTKKGILYWHDDNSFRAEPIT